jgi:Pectate lyase superfamily protein
MKKFISNFSYMHILLAILCSSLWTNLGCNKINTATTDVTNMATVSMTLSFLRKTFVNENTIYRITDYGGGNWNYDPADYSSDDNTGTVLVTKYGQRLKRTDQGPLNVKWFGAVGDSTTDDTDAFNKTFAAAHEKNLGVYIPAGVYRCNQVDKYKHILNFNAAGTSDITISGDGIRSKITSGVTSGSILLFIQAYGKCSNLIIKNLFFESTHGVTSNYNQGVFIQGTKAENFKNIKITTCRFEGFSTAIAGQGMDGAEISGNMFNAPKGHDNAMNNTSPAVFIWLFDNTNGYCSHVQVLNNTGNGYSGNAPVNTLATKRAMDGLIVASGYGFVISGNQTQNFSEEHITMTIPVTFPNTTEETIITANEMDCRIPKGSVSQNGQPHTGNYGIRCDAGNASITKNTIMNFSNGILIRTYDFPQVKENGFTIADNILISDKDQCNCLVSRGISVQGSMKIRLNRVNIAENQITMGNTQIGNSFSAIMVYDTDSCSVENNTIAVRNIEMNKGSRVGISYGRVSNVVNKKNNITGITPYHVLSNADQVLFSN